MSLGSSGHGGGGSGMRRLRHGLLNVARRGYLAGWSGWAAFQDGRSGGGHAGVQVLLPSDPLAETTDVTKARVAVVCSLLQCGHLNALLMAETVVESVLTRHVPGDALCAALKAALQWGHVSAAMWVWERTRAALMQDKILRNRQTCWPVLLSGAVHADETELVQELLHLQAEGSNSKMHSRRSATMFLLLLQQIVQMPNPRCPRRRLEWAERFCDQFLKDSVASEQDPAKDTVWQSLLDDVASSGDRDLFCMLEARGAGISPPRAVAKAAKTGQLGMVEYLIDRFETEGTAKALHGAVRSKSGALAVVEFLCERADEPHQQRQHSHSQPQTQPQPQAQPAPPHQLALELCALDESVARKEAATAAAGMVLDEPAALEAAADAGNLDILRYLARRAKKAHCHAHGGDISRFVLCRSRVLDEACECGRLDIASFLHETGRVPFTSNAMTWAASHGNLRMCEWLQVRGAPVNAWAMDLAASRGHVDIVEWLADRGHTCTEAAIRRAAELGHKAIARYLWERFFAKHATPSAADEGDAW